MTSMAVTEPHMSRLFSRIDSMPRPRDEGLTRLLQAWLQAKGEVVAPSVAAFVDGFHLLDEDAGFIFTSLGKDRRNYKLLAGADEITMLLGEIEVGAPLTEASDRRGAVRCRRLFDWVVKTGEPILVEFQARFRGHDLMSCEMMALPLMDQSKVPNAVLGGFSCRPVTNGRRHVSFVRQSVKGPLFFAFKRDERLAQSIVRRLGGLLSPLEEREFEDGEHKTRPLVDVAGREIYVIASLNGDAVQSVNDRLCRLLFFVGALKTNGAARVTAVTPYLCYLRKDRQTKSRDPLTARYVAQLFEAVGIDELITLEAHNLAALQNAFRCPVIHLEAFDMFATYFSTELNNEPVTVVAPDLGAGKRADGLRKALERRLGYPVEKAFMEKNRSMGVVSGDLFAGNITGRVAVVFDDMISSGTTMARAAEACHERGATRIYLAATHGLFAQNAPDILSKDYISGICVTNSVSSPIQMPHLEMLDASGVIARAISPTAFRG